MGIRNSRSEKSAGRARGLVIAAAFIAAFLERWWFSSAWHEAGSLTSAFYYGDAPRLVDYAIAIAQGRPFDNGIPYHPPGWPLALAGFLRLFGAGPGADFVVSVGAVKALLAAISAASVVLAAVVACDAAGPAAMIAVAFLGPFHFGHIVEGTVADTEALYGLCAITAVFATIRASRSGSTAGRLWAALAGVAGGYAMLVRAEFLACAVVLGAALIYARREGWRSQLLVFAALYGLVLVPTTVWHWRSLSAFNASHTGRVAGPLPAFAPVTSYGPFNFAMANHENADGGPNRDHPLLDRCNDEASGQLEAGQLDLACPAVLDLYVHGYRIGMSWLAGHPADAVVLVGHKLSMAIGFLAHGYLIDDLGAGVSGTRRRVDLVDPDFRALIWIHLALLGGGVWVLRRDRVVLLALLAPLAALTASTVLFYGYVRLGTGYLPIVWVFQAAAIAALAGQADRQVRSRADTRVRPHGREVDTHVPHRRGTDTQARPKISGEHAPVRPRLRSAAAVLIAMAILLGIDRARVSTPREVAIDGPRTGDGVLVQDETVEVRRLK